MPEALADLIAKGNARLITCGSWLEFTRAYLNTAGTKLGDGNFSDAGDALVSAAYYLDFANQYLQGHLGADYGFRSAWKSAMYYINQYAIWEVPEAELTMDALLSVMVTATDSQLMNFIGLVDAYRQSLWNKPFNADMFAALARGFE